MDSGLSYADLKTLKNSSKKSFRSLFYYDYVGFLGGRDVVLLKCSHGSFYIGDSNMIELYSLKQKFYTVETKGMIDLRFYGGNTGLCIFEKISRLHTINIKDINILGSIRIHGK